MTSNSPNNNNDERDVPYHNGKNHYKITIFLNSHMIKIYNQNIFYEK